MAQKKMLYKEAIAILGQSFESCLDGDSYGKFSANYRKNHMIRLNAADMEWWWCFAHNWNGVSMISQAEDQPTIIFLQMPRKIGGVE